MYDPYIDLKYRKEPEVYQEKVKQVHKELDRLSAAWGNHFDFWYRMTNENGKKRLRQANVQVWDSYDAIDLVHCCEGRTSYGGPSAASVQRQIALATALLDAWEEENA